MLAYLFIFNPLINASLTEKARTVRYVGRHSLVAALMLQTRHTARINKKKAVIMMQTVSRLNKQMLSISQKTCD